MKKVFFVVLMVSIAVFNLYSQSGVIRELTGDVELKPAGASAFVQAKAGNEVAQDTIVSTGFKSTAIIVIGSNVITVRPLTRLSLAEIRSSAGTEDLSVNLQAGRVRVEVKPPAGTKANTTVQSPSATASVRGTIFDMDLFNLDTIDGVVDYQGSDGLSMPVAAGNSSEVTGDGASKDPVEVASAALQPGSPVGTGAAGETSSSSGSFVAGEFELSLSWGKE